jgi:translation initiation factor IF-1
VDSDRARSAGDGSQVSKQVSGIVTSVLPAAMYRVRLEGGSEVLAHIADRIDRNFVRVLTGDRVRVELSPADMRRGRIVRKIA